jgi:hypothetical protein
MGASFDVLEGWRSAEVEGLPRLDVGYPEDEVVPGDVIGNRAARYVGASDIVEAAASC